MRKKNVYYKYYSNNSDFLTDAIVSAVNKKYYFSDVTQVNDLEEAVYNPKRYYGDNLKRLHINSLNSLGVAKRLGLWGALKLNFNEFKKYNLLESEQWQEEMIDHMQYAGKQMTMFCLTQDPKNRHMWEHYANFERGLCIEYEWNYVDTTVSINAPKPVKYMDNPPRISVKTWMQFERDLRSIGSTNPSINGISKFVDTLFLSKLRKWEDEKEHRSVNLEGGSGYKKIHSLEMRRIIFGKFSSEDLIKEVLRHVPHIKASKVAENSELSNFHTYPIAP